MISFISGWWVGRQGAAADRVLRALRADVRALGLGALPESVAVALRLRYQKVAGTYVVLAGVAILAVRALVVVQRDALNHAPTWMVRDLTAIRPPADSAAALVQFTWAWVEVAFLFLMLGCGLAIVRTFMDLTPLSYRLVGTWAALISDCAGLVRTADAHSTAQRRISVRLSVMRIRTARLTRGTAPLFSRRQRALRAHAEAVAASLRRAELGLDVHPEDAARELGRMALKISERYVAGLVGNLLDKEEITEVATRWEALKLAVSAVLVGAVAWAGPTLHIPDSATIAVALACVSVVYRSAVASGLGVLGLLLPLLFSGK